MAGGLCPYLTRKLRLCARRSSKGMFSRFGVPAELHSDQGHNLKSQLFAEICKQLSVRKMHTSPLRLWSDSLVERFTRTLGVQLAMVVSKEQKDWDLKLPLILLAYSSALQETNLWTHHPGLRTPSTPIS